MGPAQERDQYSQTPWFLFGQKHWGSAPEHQTRFLSPRHPLPCCGPKTESQLLPWLPTTVPRRRTQSPHREKHLPRAILTPRPQGHSPSCRISLWGGVRLPTGVYIDHPLHPPSWEPIATLFTISGAIGGCICPFLKLKHQWASESSTSPYMSTTVLWPPASVVLRAGLHDWGWCRKVVSESTSDNFSSDHPDQYHRL